MLLLFFEVVPLVALALLIVVLLSIPIWGLFVVAYVMAVSGWSLTRKHMSDILLVELLIVLVGFTGFVLGCTASLSRESGNAALITATLGLAAPVAALIAGKIREIGVLLVVMVLSFALSANIFSGFLTGARMRHDATESAEAMIREAVKQYRVEQFRENLR